MIDIVLKDSISNEPLWIDIIEPSEFELNSLAKQYLLHPALVEDCLETAHLPKLEKHGETTFIIIRHYDENCSVRADHYQSMTRKLAVFIGPKFLISVHRKDQVFLQEFRERFRNSDKPPYLQVLLLDLLMEAVETYHKPMEEMENQIHKFESSILGKQETLANWEEVFRAKSRLTVIKRILWHTLDTVQKFVPSSDSNLPLRQDLCERIESFRFFADSLLDDLTALLNIQLSLATHKANEESHKINQVMKVLTIFSAFFLPLNFIVGVYGMNFEHMPELKMQYGYYAVWGILIAVVISIYSWFVRKGWIRRWHLS